MIVFKYFYEKMDIFAPLIEEKQREEEEEEEDSYDEGSEDEGMVKLLAISVLNRHLLGWFRLVLYRHGMLVVEDTNS